MCEYDLTISFYYEHGFVACLQLRTPSQQREPKRHRRKGIGKSHSLITKLETILELLEVGTRLKGHGKLISIHRPHYAKSKWQSYRRLTSLFPPCFFEVLSSDSGGSERWREMDTVCSRYCYYSILGSKCLVKKEFIKKCINMWFDKLDLERFSNLMQYCYRASQFVNTDLFFMNKIFFISSHWLSSGRVIVFTAPL